MSDFNSTYRQIGDLGNKMGGDEGVKRFLSGELVLVERSKLSAGPAALRLQFRESVAVAACKFTVNDSFTKSNNKVKFIHINDEDLARLFGNSQKYASASELAVHRIIQASHDPEVMVALGPYHSKRFIKLGQFYQLIEVQGWGQEGPLLVNGYANIAYVLDENGAPWAVDAFWSRDHGGWYVLVYSIAHQYTWPAGSQVFSQAII